jgi:hypothetical protein
MPAIGLPGSGHGKISLKGSHVMTHREYVNACQRTEHKDLPARLLNRKTGETGILQQCVWLEAPEGMLVKVGDELTTWWPEDVEDISPEQ